MENKSSKALGLFQKLCSCRLRIDRNGKTVVNWSSLFSLACLILAPHMSIAGIILSLILGYHINLETDEEDGELEERVRKAADTVKKTAAAAARTVRDEVEKARVNREPDKKTATDRTAEPVKTAETVSEAEIPVQEFAVNQDVVSDLEKHADDFRSTSAVYGSAYAAMGGSVPILEVHEEDGQDIGPGPRHMEQ